MTSEVVVLVPVLNRPANVAPLVESFAKSETPGRLLFLCSAGDHDEIMAIDAAGAAGDNLMVAFGHSWPEKINFGYQRSAEPWLLLAADDIHFHPGWFQATEALRSQGFGVIGTNDLGNPRVLRGEHATHPLVSRAYIDQYGTIDGPGQVVHEGYRHCYADDEIVATAKARGAWAFCAESHVEHLHPFWGRASWDATYALGQQSVEADRALWESRRDRCMKA